MRRLLKLCISLVAAAALALPMVACGTSGGSTDESGPVLVKYKCPKCGLPKTAMSDAAAPRCCGGKMTRQ